jgi:hypothetical protein
MIWIYITGGVLYATLVCSFAYTVRTDEDIWKGVHYYRLDCERGGYIDQDGAWVARKVFWREWGWYSAIVLAVVFVPLLMLGLIIWERGVKQLFARKRAPVVFSGGDGSSREAAIVIGAEYSQDGIGAEYKYMQQRHGMYKVAWKRNVQYKIRAEGREYDLITIVLTADWAERKYWFDITSFSGKWR